VRRRLHPHRALRVDVIATLFFTSIPRLSTRAHSFFLSSFHRSRPASDGGARFLNPRRRQLLARARATSKRHSFARALAPRAFVALDRFALERTHARIRATRAPSSLKSLESMSDMAPASARSDAGAARARALPPPLARARARARVTALRMNDATWNAPMSASLADLRAANVDVELVTERHRALVLDVAYQTIDVVTWQRAVVLAMFDKVDVISYYDGPFALSAREAYYVPAVVRSREYNKHADHKTPRVSLHRKNIFIRDGFQCQYCGKSESLTVDHVMPQSRGGQWTWDNLVTACAKCNNAKGDRLLSSISGMALRKPARAPTVANMCLYTKHGKFVNPPEEWVAYLPEHQIVFTGEHASKGNPLREESDDEAPAQKIVTGKEKKDFLDAQRSIANSR